MNFYDGRKVEVHTICKNCGEDIVWYYVFPQNVNNCRYEVFIFTEGDNVSSANVNILEKRENEIDVNVNFNCRLCGHLHEFTGTIYKEGRELKFR